MAVYKIHKNLGETPLEVLERLRSEKNIASDVSMTFAGRLDPAAEGEMYIITAEDILHKEEYLHKDKIYEIEYILGLSTDTGDLLGILQNVLDKTNLEIDNLKESLNNLTGSRMQEFHKFSSKVVDGKPLWQHQRDGTIATAEHLVNIHRLEIISSGIVSGQDIAVRVKKICELVQGDFRQEKIIKSFEYLIQNNFVFPIIKIYAHVGSGTYMRVLGEEIGRELGIPVSAYSIVRKEIIL